MSAPGTFRDSRLSAFQIRIIFRLVEYADGLDSGIAKQEAYQYCLDSLPMLIAFVLFNIVHPGKVMPGKAGDFPSRKERKNFEKIHGGEEGIVLEPGYFSHPMIERQAGC